MKKLISLFILAVTFLNGFSQAKTIDEHKDEHKPVCAAFDPAMWEHSHRIPLRDELVTLAGDLKGKTVLDIGAGSGFFTFGFAEKAKHVIATELDNRFLDYINQKENELRLANIETRLADARQSELKNLKNVDVAVMVLVYHFIDDPEVFLKKIKSTMNAGGQIFIVEGDHFSTRFMTDYLERAGFGKITLKEFTSTGGSCGPETMRIVSARSL